MERFCFLEGVCDGFGTLFTKSPASAGLYEKPESATNLPAALPGDHEKVLVGVLRRTLGPASV